MPVSAPRCRRLRCVAVAAACVLVLGACSTDVPAGWTEREVGSLRVAHPDGWQQLGAESMGGELWDVGLEGRAGDTATVQLLLGPEFGDDDTAAEASARLVAGAQIGLLFDEWSSAGRVELEVPGATSAERWDFSYVGRDGSRVSGVWVFMADDETGRSAAVQLTGSPLDEGVTFDVVGSIRFDPQAPPAADPEGV